MYISTKKGATLVEVLFSALILTIVLVGVLFIFTQTYDMSKRIDCEYTATNLAKARIERAKTIMESSGFDSLPDLNETDTIIDSSGGSDSDGEFKRSTTVTVLDSNRTEFEVEVIYKYNGEWKDGSAITIATLFTTIR
jgi:type II secretory pathway pseudopilin PulG